MSTDFNREAKKDPAQLEREIDEQRSHIGHTLSELEQRFSPGQMLDQALSYGKENGADFSRNLVNTVKNNPVPTLMTAVGIAWMMYGQNRPPASASQYRTGYAGYDEPSSASYGLDPDYDTDLGYGADSSSGNGNGMRDKAAGLKDKASHLKDNVSGKLGGARDRASMSARGASDNMRRAGSSARNQVRSQAQRASQGFNYLVEEQPLALGAIGLALGAIIGAAIKPTRREDELLGQTRDQFAERAGHTAEDAYGKASEVGKKIAQDAKEEISAAQSSSSQQSTSQTSAPKH